MKKGYPLKTQKEIYLAKIQWNADDADFFMIK